jgi:hypothetical protein
MAPDQGGGEPGFGGGGREAEDEERADARRVVASGAWIDAFEAQTTAAMVRRVRRYAHKLAQSVASAGGVGGDFYAHELVQDALTDTLTGVLRWDPRATSLEGHLSSRIRSRARHDRVAAAAAGHESIDVDRDDDDHEGGVLEEAEAALLQWQGDAAAADDARRAVAKMRALAQDDPEVLAIMDAFDDGAENKPEVMAATRLSAKAYRNARDRLCRLGRRVVADRSTVHRQEREP